MPLTEQMVPSEEKRNELRREHVLKIMNGKMQGYTGIPLGDPTIPSGLLTSYGSISVYHADQPLMLLPPGNIDHLSFWFKASQIQLPQELLEGEEEGLKYIGMDKNEFRLAYPSVYRNLDAENLPLGTLAFNAHPQDTLQEMFLFYNEKFLPSDFWNCLSKVIRSEVRRNIPQNSPLYVPSSQELRYFS